VNKRCTGTGANPGGTGGATGTTGTGAEWRRCGGLASGGGVRVNNDRWSWRRRRCGLHRRSTNYLVSISSASNGGGSPGGQLRGRNGRIRDLHRTRDLGIMTGSARPRCCSRMCSCRRSRLRRDRRCSDVVDDDLHPGPARRQGHLGPVDVSERRLRRHARPVPGDGEARPPRSTYPAPDPTRLLSMSPEPPGHPLSQ